MQWSDKRFAGFTTGNATWIEVSDDYHSVNVEVGWVVVFFITDRICTEWTWGSPAYTYQVLNSEVNMVEN